MILRILLIGSHTNEKIPDLEGITSYGISNIKIFVKTSDK